MIVELFDDFYSESQDLYNEFPKTVILFDLLYLDKICNKILS